ncbi:MAG: nuclear transport factor 2 family protein [Acidobacteriota bacterium]
MRTRILTAALVALAAAAPVFGQAVDKAAVAKTLIANENKINEAVAKGDAATFTSLLAPEAVSADGMTGFTKAADFSKTLNQLKITFWHMMNPQVVWIDDKSAVVAYTWMGAGTYMGKPVPDMTYSSTVWTERGGKWLAVFHQESSPAPAAAPAPAPAKKK